MPFGSDHQQAEGAGMSEARSLEINETIERLPANGDWQRLVSKVPSRKAQLTAYSVVCRLAVCLLTLVFIDFTVEPLLRSAEHRRYDSGVCVRFGSSDLFLVGPISNYLREHPVGARSRVAFFGNSSIWGYGLTSQETVPAAFQRLSSQTQVFNFGMNGFETGSAYLMTKTVIDAMDAFYVFDMGHHRAHPMLSRLIPVSAEDIRRFELEEPNTLEYVLDKKLGFWKLYRYADRLQGAWFGSSTRQYVYLNKSQWVSGLLGRNSSSDTPSSEVLPAQEAARWLAEAASHKPGIRQTEYLRGRYPVIWDLAQLLADHRKRGFILQYDASGKDPMYSGDRALFNAQFQPYVQVVGLEIPDSWLLDDRHYSAAGAEALARTLYQHTALINGL